MQLKKLLTYLLTYRKWPKRHEAVAGDASEAFVRCVYHLCVPVPVQLPFGGAYRVAYRFATRYLVSDFIFFFLAKLSAVALRD